MMYMLAQSGGGGWGGVFNPATLKIAFYVIFGLFVLLGGVFKKISEKNAQRAAEKARERRRDEMLRTGRDESGAFVDVSRVPAQALAPAVTAASDATDEAARERLKALAERRRRELAEMMKRAAQAGSVSGGVGGGGPRAGTRTPARVVQQMPQAEQLQAGVRRNAEPDRRQQQQQQKGQKQGKKGKGSPQRMREQETSMPYAMPAAPAGPTGPTSAPVHSAYTLPQDRTSTPLSDAQLTATDKITAAMTRIGGQSGTADWRRAVVLSELMQKPVSMRGPDERVM